MQTVLSHISKSGYWSQFFVRQILLSESDSDVGACIMQQEMGLSLPVYEYKLSTVSVSSTRNQLPKTII